MCVCAYICIYIYMKRDIFICHEQICRETYSSSHYTHSDANGHAHIRIHTHRNLKHRSNSTAVSWTDGRLSWRACTKACCKWRRSVTWLRLPRKMQRYPCLQASVCMYMCMRDLHSTVWWLSCVHIAREFSADSFTCIYRLANVLTISRTSRPK